MLLGTFSKVYAERNTRDSTFEFFSGFIFIATSGKIISVFAQSPARRARLLPTDRDSISGRNSREGRAKGSAEED